VYHTMPHENQALVDQAKNDTIGTRCGISVGKINFASLLACLQVIERYNGT
ncbi:uncharacterized protein METZ01_LOCUS412830, partial [marine metagenome]